MAETIQRYTPVRTSMFGAMAENLSGEYVTHADHLATLAAKDAEWKKWAEVELAANDEKWQK